MPKGLILITGANGHLGFRTLVELVRNGYRARIAHRRAGQIDMIRSQKSIQPFLSSIEFTQVLDITTPDAYDVAIKGVDGVIHHASPMPTFFDPDDHDWKKLMYDPAEKGVLNMLTAAAKEPSVKRVVVTSTVAIIDWKDGKALVGRECALTRSNRSLAHKLRCSEFPIPDAETLKSYSNASDAYAPSKIQAHHASNKFMEKNKPHFDLIRVLPGYVQGADELYTSAADMRDFDKLGSNEGVMGIAIGGVTGAPRLTIQALIDDVCKAHVLALEPQHGKNGENLVIVGEGGKSRPWKDYVKIMEALYPEAVKKGLITPKSEDPDILVDFDLTLTEKALGFPFAGAEEMVRSVVGQYLALQAST